MPDGATEPPENTVAVCRLSDSNDSAIGKAEPSDRFVEDGGLADSRLSPQFSPVFPVLDEMH
jgi:hypothetical protein